MSFPTKFTEPRQQIILEAVAKGCMPTGAAKLAGVSHQTLHSWLTSDDAQSREFQQQLRHAEGVAECAAEEHVFKHDFKFWLLCGPARERYDEDGNLIRGWAKGPGKPQTKELKDKVAQLTKDLAELKELIGRVCTASPEVAKVVQATWNAMDAEKQQADRPVAVAVKKEEQAPAAALETPSLTGNVKLDAEAPPAAPSISFPNAPKPSDQSKPAAPGG